MRGRLRTLEAAVNAVEDAETADQRMAGILLRIWRYEAAQGLTEEEQYERMKVAREIHAGNPDVWPQVEALLREEAEYMKLRRTRYVAGLEEGQRRYWERLLRQAMSGQDPVGA